MADPAVFNASPLIFLFEADLPDIIRVAGSPLFVPRAVVAEVERFGPLDPTARAIREADWLAVVDPVPPPPVIQHWDLGNGETAVLTWAHSHSATTALVDDLPARRCASSLGIPVRGTLGLVLVAKQRGVIPKARRVLERLIAAGMYLAESIVTHALEMVGE